MSMGLLGPALVIVISAFRSPAIMMQGHLWAEDSFFLTHMLTEDSFASKILYIINGHLEILNSIVFFAASHLKLKMVPLLTSYFGLLIECVLSYLIIFFRSDLRIKLVPALLVSVLVVVSPCASEHQLNMLNSVWLTSAIILIIINLPSQRLESHQPSVAAAVLVLGLSGIPAACLMPVALLHAVAWRSRPHLLIAAALLLCDLVQGTLILAYGIQHRFSSVSPWVYLAAPYFHILVEHLMGVEAASALGHWFLQSQADDSTVLSLMLAPIVLVIWMLLFVLKGKDMRAKLSIATFLYIVVFNITFAIGDRNDLFSIYDMRYFFVPFLVLALLIARMCSVSPQRLTRCILSLMFFVTLLSTKDYFQDGYNGMYVTPQRNWRQDVADCAARGGPCRIEVDPGGFYAVDVPNHITR